MATFDSWRIRNFTNTNTPSDEAVSGIEAEIRPIWTPAGGSHESEEVFFMFLESAVPYFVVVFVFVYVCVHVVANLLPGAASPLSFDYSSDILRSIIMRTKVLMLNLLEGCDPGVVIADMYDLFQVNPDHKPSLNPNPILILALTLALALNLNLSLSLTLTWGLLLLG